MFILPLHCSVEHSLGSSARKFSTGLRRRGSSFGKAKVLQVEFSISRPSWLSWEELTPLARCCHPTCPTAALDLCLSFSLLFCLLIFNLSHFRVYCEAQKKKHTTKCPPQSYHVLCRHFPQITFSSLQCSLFPWWPLVAGTEFRISLRILIYWDRALKPRGSSAKGVCKLQAANPN